MLFTNDKMIELSLKEVLQHFNTDINSLNNVIEGDVPIEGEKYADDIFTFILKDKMSFFDHNLDLPMKEEVADTYCDLVQCDDCELYNEYAGECSSISIENRFLQASQSEKLLEDTDSYLNLSYFYNDLIPLINGMPVEVYGNYVKYFEDNFDIDLMCDKLNYGLGLANLISEPSLRILVHSVFLNYKVLSLPNWRKQLEKKFNHIKVLSSLNFNMNRISEFNHLIQLHLSESTCIDRSISNCLIEEEDILTSLKSMPAIYLQRNVDAYLASCSNIERQRCLSYAVESTDINFIDAVLNPMVVRTFSKSDILTNQLKSLFAIYREAYEVSKLCQVLSRVIGAHETDKHAITLILNNKLDWKLAEPLTPLMANFIEEHYFNDSEIPLSLISKCTKVKERQPCEPDFI